MSMGHIITGLAIHFVPRKFVILRPLDRQVFDEEFLVKAEIIINFGMLEDVNNRRCYQLPLQEKIDIETVKSVSNSVAI